ncbi:MAG: polyprenyl synthetase family protein [Lewinellaceae bacterium]|nr:polyprenyl synthetase family protein [Lewinellaceae bacterium]
MKDIRYFQSAFEIYLADEQLDRRPVNLYEPVRYIMGLGGKRIRPVLTLMGAYLFGDRIREALPAALAMEIFHNFSLVHDDIMDEAPLRRGQPTVHSRFGLNAGILSGDVMLIMSYEYLLKSPVDELARNRAVAAFTRAAAAVCEGQQMDMDFETRSDVSLQEYLTMIEGKTAALLGGCLEVGALVGGGADTEPLTGFGRKVGIAFQIQDDYLDTFGDPAKFGKQTGGDILQNKKTALYLIALEKADPSRRDQLLGYYSNEDWDPEEKIRGVTDLFNQLGVPQEARKLQAAYQEEAFRLLDSVAARAARKEPLIQLANQLLEREL